MPVGADELQRNFDEMRHIDSSDTLTRGVPLAWKTILAVALATLRRAINGEPLTVIELHLAIESTVNAHFWRMDRFQYDRLAEVRNRHLDILARLMLQVAKDDWLADLLHKPVAIVPSTTVGEIINSRRQRDGLTMEQLAERTGVTEGSVSRWIGNVCKPRPNHRAALNRVLGGEESDYA